MPDPTKQTVSATQSAGLLGCSPYLTRWLLYQHFANGLEIGAVEDDFIREGRRMQPLVLERASDELRLQVEQNEGNDYIRRGQLGATRDAQIFCPDRGPGALETKCVFNFQVWAVEWANGQRVPAHVEVQLQQQMLVGDGVRPFDWGVIAVWVAAQQFYFERSPLTGVWQRLETEAASFLDDVANLREPEPFGSAVELDWLERIYPTIPKKVLDWRELEEEEAQERAIRLAERGKVYLRAKAQANTADKVAEAIRAEMIATMRDAETLMLPGGVFVRLGARRRLKVSASEPVDPANPDATTGEDDDD